MVQAPKAVKGVFFFLGLVPIQRKGLWRFDMNILQRISESDKEQVPSIPSKLDVSVSAVYSFKFSHWHNLTTFIWVLFWKGGFSTLPGQLFFWLSIPIQSLVGPDSNILQACFPLWSHKHHKCSGALCDLGSLLDDEAWPVRLPAPHALFDSTHSKLRRTCTEFEFCQMPK